MHDKKRQRCEQLCSLGQAKHAQEVSTFFSENLTQQGLMINHALFGSLGSHTLYTYVR